MHPVACAICREDLPEPSPTANLVQHPVYEADGGLDYIELAHRACAPEWSPDTMVPGYQKCYVDGCWENAVVSAIHKRFGRVTGCLCHNPGNHGMAKPLGYAVAVVEPEPLDKIDQMTKEVEEFTPEQRIAGLLKEVLMLTLKGFAPPAPKDPEGGVKARLQPPVPKLPSGGVGIPVPH